MTVIIALTANIGVAVAKSVVAALTGSASMLAEAAHSWSDSANEALLLVADKRSGKPPD
ncbi:MAG TPA: cation transporter, partial [Bacillota bacterium]|nr:cation transporter [Bacillota bacterium]